ncbi:MAG: hypothetical protein HZR80_11935 [Candidatus Heimdallarchaeota archaeon]
MHNELKLLKKRYQSLSKEEIFSAVRIIRSKLDLKKDQKKTTEFAEMLYLLMELFSQKGDSNSERIILNQLVEVAWWAKELSETFYVLSRGISKLLIDSRATRGKDRIELFSDFIDIIARFPENKIIYSAISTAAVELIKWGSDKEILDILDIMQEKSAIYPLVNAIQLLDAKVFMNTLFYLDEQDCNTLLRIYKELSSFSISHYQDEVKDDCHSSSLIFGVELNEILQEGAINAIIGLARVNSKLEDTCEECINGIKEIIEDSEYLLRKEGKEFFKDIYRLSYAFDQFKLWGYFLKLPLIEKLKEERDKNETYQLAEAKLLAIIKNMRIEEYDSLKIGRRGIVLAYDLNDLEDISKIAEEISKQSPNRIEPIELVEELDAIIEFDDELKDHLRETGQIPTDRKTVDELQDMTSKDDDLTKPAIRENKIVKQLLFLKQLEFDDNRFLVNQLLYTKALIFAVGMFGFNSPLLKVTPGELVNHIEGLCERRMILELVDPLVRAVTLRAARLDGEATSILFDLLNHRGVKFLTKYYKQYNFVDNLIRLISYLGRTGEKELLIEITNELEKANRMSLEDDKISLRIARAFNEGILSYSAKNPFKKLELLEILREFAKVHSFNVNIQIKYVEGLNFVIIDLALDNFKAGSKIIDKLIDFSKTYRNNQQIEEKAALGLLWAMIISRIYKQPIKLQSIRKEFNFIVANYPQSSFLQGLNEICESMC